jgi:hypothetical protein
MHQIGEFLGVFFLNDGLRSTARSAVGLGTNYSTNPHASGFTITFGAT